ncbi:MAG: histidine phosphatase family protein [Actinomycetota bacterium]
MARTVTLIRHAETNANRAGRWQGHADSGLSSHGEEQLELLAGRRNGQGPDLLVASDLSRTMQTAAMIGDPTPDAAWREFGVGDWEGLTSVEITARFPNQMEAFLRGEDIAPGGGEQMSHFGMRVNEAFESVVASISDGENAVVVTHGGVIWAVMGAVLGLAGSPIRMVPSHNTGSTVIRINDDGSRQIAVFNDATHLNEHPTQFGPAGTTVSIFRHGQTEANLEGRWQGRTNSPLTPQGQKQVESASSYLHPMEAIYTSPLGRAVETASILGSALGLAPVDADGLIEMSFGSWENMTTTEAIEADPELFDLIYGQGEDMPRGRDGESFTETGVRIRSTVAAMTESSELGHIGVVSHGAAIRAYVTNVIGLSFATRELLPIPRNSSMSQIRHTANGPVLSAYNVAPHLDA